MENKNRRDFLKKSILGVSGAALIPGALKASGSFGPDSVVKSALPVRTLGKTGLKIPVAL